MKIIIPSSNRVNLLNTLRYLDGLDVTLLVYPDEVQAYKRHPVDIAICPDRGIAKKRQYVIDNYDKAIMLDDDLSFATRRDDDPTKFHSAGIGEERAHGDDNDPGGLTGRRSGRRQKPFAHETGGSRDADQAHTR